MGVDARELTAESIHTAHTFLKDVAVSTGEAALIGGGLWAQWPPVRAGVEKTGDEPGLASPTKQYHQHSRWVLKLVSPSSCTKIIPIQTLVF